MINLSKYQINQKKQFIHNYLEAMNPASASQVDANANVTNKNIATLEAELNKDLNIQINRSLMYDKIQDRFSKNLANEYLRQIEQHEIYVHDETSLKPYCASISMYPFLLNGLTQLGGDSTAPQHLESFAGSFINLIFAISSQFAGAIATVEFLLYFDHFARKDYGENYLQTQKHHIKQLFEHIVYSINQPAAARGYQSVFWNISIYDQFYFSAIFQDFVFPDFDRPQWTSVQQLQEFFMQWFREERTKAILTFPVITAALLTKDGKPKDQTFANFCASELSKGHSFFIYQSDSADSLASCCRLRNEINDTSFSYSLGAGGVATGSINVITLNMNRLIQQNTDIKKAVQKVQKYQVAYRDLMQDYYARGLLPVYTAGFISFDKQFLTIGVNGLVEAAEYLNISPARNKKYIYFMQQTLKIIYDTNREATKEFGCKFNTEFVPAENLGVKNAKWDKADGLFTPRDCYNSYLYPVEDTKINAIEKFYLHGQEITQYLDGGSALHLNLEEHLSQTNYLQLLNIAAQTGCNYFCTNVKMTVCNDCGYINTNTLTHCSKCKSKNIDYATRVIGYLKRVSSFSSSRQLEHQYRNYHSQQIGA